MPMSLCDVREIACEKCDELSTKQVSLSGFELKGGGWFGSGYQKSE
jgi:predicted nucleic acid-binding Zn ribbon protein